MPPTPSKETTSYRPSRVPEGTPMFRLGAIETILTSVLKIERVLIVDYKANLRHECVSKSRPSGRGHGLQDPAGEISRSEFAASRAQEDKDSNLMNSNVSTGLSLSARIQRRALETLVLPLAQGGGGHFRLRRFFIIYLSELIVYFVP